MLLEFSVENYKSFKNRVTFSMVPASDKTKNNRMKNYFEYSNSKKVLYSACIYGANAAGKSNILRALDYMEKLVRTSHQNNKDELIETSPFKLDPDKINEPSVFDIQFIHKGIKYAYGFKLDSTKILEEYLYYWPNDRQKIIFERFNTNDYRFVSDKSRQVIISGFTPKNMLYLSNAYKLASEELTDIANAYSWFDRYCFFVLNLDPTNDRRNLRYLYEDEKLQKKIKSFLHVADLGIHNITIKEKELDDKFLDQLVAAELKESFKSLFSYELSAIHKVKLKNEEDYTAEFDWNDESEGTKKFLSLLVPIIFTLEMGSVLVVDEIDVSLHTKLTEYIVNLFNDPNYNTNNAQLIFSTHDTNLLGNNLFRRDQIWLVEKNDETGSSDLYSLIELKIRNDENIERGYLKGRYGAIPFINGGDFIE